MHRTFRHPPASVAPFAVAVGLALSACSGGEATLTPLAGSDAPQPSVVEIGAQDLAFTLDDLTSVDTELTFTAKAGTVVIRLANAGLALHDVTIEEISRNTKVTEAAPGSSSEGTIELVPGTYIFYCSVTGHRLAGMKGILEVS